MESAYPLVPDCSQTHILDAARARTRVRACFPEPTTRQNRGVLSSIPIPGAGMGAGGAPVRACVVLPITPRYLRILPLSENRWAAATSATAEIDATCEVAARDRVAYTERKRRRRTSERPPPSAVLGGEAFALRAPYCRAARQSDETTQAIACACRAGLHAFKGRAGARAQVQQRNAAATPSADEASRRNTADRRRQDAQRGGGRSSTGRCRASGTTVTARAARTSPHMQRGCHARGAAVASRAAQRALAFACAVARGGGRREDRCVRWR